MMGQTGLCWAFHYLVLEMIASNIFWAKFKGRPGSIDYLLPYWAHPYTEVLAF